MIHIFPVIATLLFIAGVIQLVILARCVFAYKRAIQNIDRKVLSRSLQATQKNYLFWSKNALRVLVELAATPQVSKEDLLDFIREYQDAIEKEIREIEGAEILEKINS